MCECVYAWLFQKYVRAQRKEKQKTKKTKTAYLPTSKKKKDVYKMFGNAVGFLWSLKYRVNQKGTLRVKVQAQKHVSLLIKKGKDLMLSLGLLFWY